MLTTVSRIRALSLSLLAVPLLLLTAFTVPATAAPSCAAVHIVVIPGSNETNSLDSMNAAVKRSVLGNVTERLIEADYTIKTSYIPYPARIFGMRGVVPWVEYNGSKNTGYGKTWSLMRSYHEQCPGTQFILVGYSQGAHIAGDISATVGSEGTPVPANRLRGAYLLADPARSAWFTSLVGMESGGAGGLAGGRTFGSVSSRVIEYCIEGDGICDYTGPNLSDVVWDGGKHVQYNSLHVPGTSQTFTQRMEQDIVNAVLLLNNPQF